MRINKNTSFPQPVLNFKDDFKTNNLFDFDLYRELKDKKYHFTFDFKLENSFLKTMLKQNLAYYLIEIDCEDTLFRESFRKNENDNTLIIQGSDLRDKYTIQVFICSCSNIENYTCEDFNDDYSGYNLSLQENDVIGYGGERIDSAQKKWDPIKKISDFIKIKKSGVEDDHNPIIDLSDHSIYISVSEKDFEKYQNLKSFEDDSEPFFHTEYVLPALIEVLSQMDETDHRDLKWYDKIIDKIQSDEDLKSLYSQGNYYELAQAILKNPAAESLRRLQNYITQNPTGDEGEF